MARGLGQIGLGMHAEAPPPRQGRPRAADLHYVSAPTLHISHVPEYDDLFALPLGATYDGQPAERWRAVADGFAYYLDLESGEPLGFAIRRFSEIDLDADRLAEIWAGPRFAVPLLGLDRASAGEVALAARAFLDGEPTINRVYFDLAVNAEGEHALALWRCCLEAGDMMAHFALGYTHYELGHFHEAYRHLRHYSELAPAQPWVWCWFGRAAAAIGEPAEARAAFERAIALTEAGAEETDAEDLLEALAG